MTLDKTPAIPNEPAFWPAALIPCYNHPKTVGLVAKTLRRYGLPVLIVNDGSNAETRAVLDCLAAEEKGVMVIHRPENGGKGAAVLTGFKAALHRRFTHVLQVDADAQHDLNEIPTFLRVAKAEPDKLVCGYPVYDETVPKARLFGRKLTNFWCAVNGLSLSFEDAMCGMRVYPMTAVEKVLDAHIGARMDFDPEILVRLLWLPVPVRNVPVRVTYPKGSVSHFDMVDDNVRISLMHARLCVGMIVRLPWILGRRLRRLCRLCRRNAEACTPMAKDVSPTENRQNRADRGGRP